MIYCICFNLKQNAIHKHTPSHPWFHYREWCSALMKNRFVFIMENNYYVDLLDYCLFLSIYPLHVSLGWDPANLKSIDQIKSNVEQITHLSNNIYQTECPSPIQNKILFLNSREKLNLTSLIKHWGLVK